MQLNPGSRVVIVGGGPAGSFSALHLLREANQAGLALEVQIFEGRDFTRPGPSGCDKCAGVLSSSLVDQMQTLDLQIPKDIILANLTSYVLHFGREMLTINRSRPDGHVLSVSRGSGPRLGEPETSRSFDRWLLDQVQMRGAEIVKRYVDRIIPGELPRVLSGGQAIEADLVILANGVNSRSPLDPTWGYSPPRCEVMAQNEASQFGIPVRENVHIYFSQPAGLLFGALVPKGSHINISLLGDNLTPKSVQTFLDSHKIMDKAPSGEDRSPNLLCGCSPRVAVSSARGYFADRMVVVGDAAVTRLYKNGIGSAFATAAAAARCAVKRGVSAGDFARGYRPVSEAIAVDNRYGRMLFEVWKLIRDTPVLRRRWQNALVSEERLPLDRQVHRNMLWYMFTGDRSYAQIFWQAFSIQSLLGMLRGAK